MTRQLAPVPAQPPRLVNLRALLAFVTVAEQRSFTRAGRVLIVDSSTVSKLVRMLEQQLGTQLLIRSTRTVHGLTPAGELVLTRGRALLEQSALLLGEVEALPETSG